MQKRSGKRGAILAVGLLVAAILGWLVLSEKQVPELIRGAYDSTSCLVVMVQEGGADGDARLVPEEIRALLDSLKEVSVRYAGQYKYFQIDTSTPVYRLFFDRDGKDLGALIVNGNYVYTRTSRYRLDEADVPAVQAAFAALNFSAKG